MTVFLFFFNLVLCSLNAWIYSDTGHWYSLLAAILCGASAMVIIND